MFGHLSPDTQILIYVNVGGLLFYSGVLFATLRSNSKEIKAVRKNVAKVQREVAIHDREISSIWSQHMPTQREVLR